ncbi:hypothetical protein HOY80DRAFT_959527 [Tuber brumale]|nr:hypothetical protein HOY80DRAFT_959527 [Tuber brumale]
MPKTTDINAPQHRTIQRFSIFSLSSLTSSTPSPNSSATATAAKMSLPKPLPTPTADTPAPKKNTPAADPADTIVPAGTPIVVVVTSGPCTHERLIREPNRICNICHRRHFFNWAYYCEACQASACHNCRPRWAERTWVTFATVLGEWKGGRK